MKFPAKVFLAIDPNDDSEDKENLLAYRNQAAGIDRDGPTEIAEYKLVHVEKLAKKVVNVFSKK
jgi:hypothetical protein